METTNTTVRTTVRTTAHTTTSRFAGPISGIGRDRRVARTAVVGLSVAAVGALAACGGDGADGPPFMPLVAHPVPAEAPVDDAPVDDAPVSDAPLTDPPSQPEPPGTANGADDHGAGHQRGGVVVISGRDYAFDDVPESVPAGTRLGFRNTAAAELHELVAFRLPDDEQRSVDELIMLAPDELQPLLGAPATVLLQPPGSSETIVAVGDGTLVEPGRYAVMCFIPVGADPGEYLAAAAAAGGEAPTGVAGGPPHFTAGMYAELLVTP